MADSPSDVLFATLGGGETPSDLRPAIDDKLASMAAEGAKAWPSLSLSAADFVAYVAARLPETDSLERSLEQIRAADLYIACACSRGDERALQAFERAYFGSVDAALARVRDAPIDGNELRQRMRERFFVAEPGSEPRIASYLGKGDLRGWVRIAATRALLDLVRTPRRNLSLDDSQVGDCAVASGDPEVAFLKQTYRADFRRAFTHALESLSPRQRNLLRHRYLHDLRVEEIAQLYSIHRVTASRQMTKAQETLQAGIRRYFITHLEIGRTELASIMGLIASQLHLSLSRLLRTEHPNAVAALEE